MSTKTSQHHCNNDAGHTKRGVMQHLTEAIITVHRVKDNLQHLTAVITVHRVKDMQHLTGVMIVMK